jgi:hypothetical protein
MKLYNLRIIRLLAVLSVILALSNCKHPAPETTPAFHPAITAFTSGTVSGQANIRVVLAEDYAEAVAPNTPVGKKVFRFKPAPYNVVAL